MNATMTLNQELNGIEIKFDCKPIRETIDSLKAAGFRWHNVKKLWYAKQNDSRLKLAKEITGSATKEAEPKAEPKTVVTNKFGIQVGDIFSASWGYEQTNNDFFQVIELVGKTSVRVREVYPEITEREAVSGMSEDRTYKITRDLLPPREHSVFITDQEKGDLKRLKSYAADGVSNPQFKLSSFCDAYYCEPGSHKCYESWYY